jgi:O-antigen/teichoic acid export membrane protein
MKTNRNSKLLGNSLIYIVMSFIQKAAGFLLLPIYTSYLSPEQFGMANVVTASATIYILIFSMALDDAVARFYFIYKSDPKKKAAFLGSVVLFTLVISIIGSAALLIFKGTFFGLFLNNEVPSSLIILGIISIATSPLYTIQQKINIIEEKPYHYTLNTFGFFLLNTALCILFITKYNMGALGLLLSAAIVQSVFFIYSFVYLRNRMRFVFEFYHLKDALMYSLPLLPNRVASWGLVNFNKIYLGKLLSNAAVGIFNVASYFGLIITVFSSSVSLAYQPFVYRMLENGKKGKGSLEKVIILLVSLFSISGLIIATFSNELLTIFIDKQYSNAGAIIPMVVWTEAISAISSSYIYILFYYKNTPKYISYNTILAAIINIGGCVVLVPVLGILGAVISLFISTIFSAGYMFYHARRVSGINLSVWKMVSIPVTLFLVTFLIQYFLFNIFIKMLILVFVFLLIASFNRTQLIYIYKMIKN